MEGIKKLFQWSLGANGGLYLTVRVTRRAIGEVGCQCSHNSIMALQVQQFLPMVARCNWWAVIDRSCNQAHNW